MNQLKEYYNKTYWLSEPNTLARKNEERIRVKFDDLDNEDKNSIKETLGYKLYCLSQAWQNLKSVVLKSIKL